MGSSTDIERIPVVVGIIQNKQGQLLVAKRPLHVVSGGFWEFPGGKVEPGEAHQTALCREIKEEVALEVLEASPFFTINYDSPTRLIHLNFWHITAFKGKARGAEGQLIRWVPFEEISRLNMLPANQHVMQALKELLFIK